MAPVHLHIGSPCTICGFPLQGIDAVNFLQGGIHPPQVHKVELTTTESLKPLVINMGGWISIEQAMPLETKRYLVYAKFNNHSSIHIASYMGKDEWRSKGEKLNVTHWQPLPVAPTN